MKTEFKNVIKVIDKLVLQSSKAGSLFDDRSLISALEEQLLTEWSGKSMDEANLILSPAYGKRQVPYNPFAAGEKTSTNMRFIPLTAAEQPEIRYTVRETKYGNMILASTLKGICYLVFFSGSEDKIPAILIKAFPGSVIAAGTDEHQAKAMSYLNGHPEQVITLHAKGTPEQLRIWEALTQVPAGKLVSYGTLAKATGQMAQDTGVMMGDNRIAILIPCHRVIKATGEAGQYHWGAKRKQAMILQEAVFNQ
jgi:O-6-methylguanine DNA methyltransferase